jgi:cytochrome oxidase Cu insertion factor (SCO1/SenC/PrrC family)
MFVHRQDGIGLALKQQEKEDDMKRTISILVVFALLVGCASTSHSPAPSVKVGNAAPDFSLVDASGNQVRLSEFKGKKNVVLIFYKRHE